ncbi:hypothetical protein [Falsiroseomonas sp.]|uniref:hypothetical protein n=1 Tax=Falsiroseomonas sp. TaxID=2870721 RepID=UPI00356A1209
MISASCTESESEPKNGSVADCVLARRFWRTPQLEEATMVTAIETALPALSAARCLVDRFHHMVPCQDA